MCPIVREGASYLRVDESKEYMEDPISTVVGSLATDLGISDVTMQLLIGSIGLVLMAFSFPVSYTHLRAHET